jgi:hypothetical protein
VLFSSDPFLGFEVPDVRPADLVESQSVLRTDVAYMEDGVDLANDTGAIFLGECGGIGRTVYGT